MTNEDLNFTHILTTYLYISSLACGAVNPSIVLDSSTQKDVTRIETGCILCLT